MKAAMAYPLPARPLAAIREPDACGTGQRSRQPWQPALRQPRHEWFVAQLIRLGERLFGVGVFVGRQIASHLEQATAQPLAARAGIDPRHQIGCPGGRLVERGDDLIERVVRRGDLPDTARIDPPRLERE